jgi:hypothetical protein
MESEAFCHAWGLITISYACLLERELETANALRKNGNECEKGWLKRLRGEAWD